MMWRGSCGARNLRARDLCTGRVHARHGGHQLVGVVVVVVHPLLPLLQLALGMEGLSTGFRLEAGYIPAS